MAAAFSRDESSGAIAAIQEHSCDADRSIRAFCRGRSATYFAEPSINCFVKLQSDVGVIATVNEVVAVALLPAASMALAVRVVMPSAKLYAGPFVSAQVLDARPERTSPATQRMSIVWS